MNSIEDSDPTIRSRRVPRQGAVKHYDFSRVYRFGPHHGEARRRSYMLPSQEGRRRWRTGRAAEWGEATWQTTWFFNFESVAECQIYAFRYMPMSSRRYNEPEVAGRTKTDPCDSALRRVEGAASVPEVDTSLHNSLASLKSKYLARPGGPGRALNALSNSEEGIPAPSSDGVDETTASNDDCARLHNTAMDSTNRQSRKHW